MNSLEKIKIIIGLIFKKSLKLDPNEMAFRAVYEDLLKNKKINTVYRPGKRDCNENRGYCKLQIITAKVIDKPGADWAFVPPKFKNFSRNIVVKKINVKKISELKKEDFIGSSPDINSIESLKFHLGLIYNIPLESLSADYLVTIINFDYLD